MAKTALHDVFQSPRIRCISVLGIALALAACSHHPKIEDVADLPTEKIVEHVRCEARTAIVREMLAQFDLPNEPALIERIKKFEDATKAADEADRRNPGAGKLPAWIADDRTNMTFLAQIHVGIGYDFDFNITEDNTATGAVGFQIPYVAPAAFDLGANANAHLTRAGQRKFKAAETWARLVLRGGKPCRHLEPRERRLDYPVAGRSGMDRLVSAFLGIHRQNVAKDDFVETLTFTTEVGVGISGVLKLTPVPNNFRLVGANATLGASRKDIHKLVVSMAFPNEFVVGAGRHTAFDAPFDRPPQWRARYNLCVADARQREDKFNALHHQPPEIYCVSYAEQFLNGVTIAAVATPVRRSSGQAELRAVRPQPNVQRGPAREGESLRFLYYRKVPSYLNVY